MESFTLQYNLIKKDGDIKDSDIKEYIKLLLLIVESRTNLYRDINTTNKSYIDLLKLISDIEVLNYQYNTYSQLNIYFIIMHGDTRSIGYIIDEKNIKKNFKLIKNEDSTINKINLDICLDIYNILKHYQSSN